MKKVLVLLMAIVTIMLATSCGTARRTPEEWIKYTLSEGDFNGADVNYRIVEEVSDSYTRRQILTYISSGYRYKSYLVFVLTKDKKPIAAYDVRLSYDDTCSHGIFNHSEKAMCKKCLLEINFDRHDDYIEMFFGSNK